MNWTKCEDRLPENMEPVFVTFVQDNGLRETCADVRWNEDEGGWEALINAETDEWVIVESEITHWMAYPDPAED